MAILRWQYVAFVAMAAWLANCTDCHRTANPPQDAIPAVVPPADTLAILTQLEYLGNIAYDHPDQFIHNPDSFVNLLPALPGTAEGREMYAWLLLNIGYGLREAGNLLGSVKYYEQAMEYCATHQLAEPDFILYIAKPLGNLYTQIGDLQKALHIHELAVTHAKRRGDNTELPALFTNFATAYQQIGRPDSLLRICEEGLQYTDRGHPSVALLYNILASAYQQLGRLDSARRYNALAIERFASRSPMGDTVIWYTNTLHQQAVLAVEQGQLDNALRYLNRAIEVTEHTFPDSKQRDRAKYYHARGSLYYRLQRDTDAIKDFKRALHAFAPASPTLYFPDYTYTEALLGLARTHAVIGHSDSTIHYYAKAIENAYYTQQLIVSNESHYQNSAWNRGLLGEAADQLWNAYTVEQASTKRQSLAETLCWLTELSKGRQLLQEINRTAQWRDNDDPQLRKRQQLQLLYQAIAQATDSLEKSRLTYEAEQVAFEFQLTETHFNQSFGPPDASAFIRQLTTLSDSSTLISYFITPVGDAYVTSFKDRHASVHRVPADSLAGLSGFIKSYFADGPDSYDNDPHAYTRRASRIADMLLPSLNADTDARLNISPDGLLFMLPFDALIHDQQFLGHGHVIQYTYTFLLQTASDHTPMHQHPAVRVFAKSRYDAASGLRDLPAVTQEAAHLAKRFRAVSFWDDEATDSTFFHALENGDLIHIAAHAVADGHTDPYIALNQPLTLGKLRYARATSPLVFLSACQTASGEWLPGEGLESLNKAFLSKGVQGVVAAYWPVDDRATTALTRSFYEALSETGHPAEALALAKRRYIAAAPKTAQNPWYWASLQFTGTDTCIVIRPPQPGLYRLSIIFIAILASCLVGWAWWRTKRIH